MLSSFHNPDILTCLANLSSDEVFTPPNIANQMLDTLPKELWSNKDATFLDPVSKSGVFLREITKRLLKGLESEIPDIEKRLEHILKNQVFGIGITRLTSEISRRTLYCSKKANGRYSIVNFSNEEGNLRYFESDHFFADGIKCKYCGVNKKLYKRDEGLESYAYSFIHEDKLEELFNMKFDVIIGNPPYQMNMGNKEGNSSKAMSIYDKFFDAAEKLQPNYISFIIPSRWMTTKPEGISSEWIKKMMRNRKFREVHDFLDSKSCFPVPVEGGVNYFLWDKNYDGKCSYSFYENINTKIPSTRFDYLDSKNLGIIIRDPKATEIIDKIELIEGNYYTESKNNFSSLVSPKDFFTNKTQLTSSWKDYKDKKDASHNIKYYVNTTIHKKDFGWISSKQVPKNHNSIGLFKVLITAAYGAKKIVGNPFTVEKNSACSQTFLVIGYDPDKHNFSETECKNIESYIRTKTFRYLVSIKKKTQNGPRDVYQFVPLQNFNEEWSDEKLFKKYSFTESQIKLINLLEEY